MSLTQTPTQILARISSREGWGSGKQAQRGVVFVGGQQQMKEGVKGYLYPTPKSDRYVFCTTIPDHPARKSRMTRSHSERFLGISQSTRMIRPIWPDDPTPTRQQLQQRASE